MYRNYFYLNRAVLELNTILDSHKIRSIYSQEKDTLIIECTMGLEKRFFLEICVNPGYPFITVKDDASRARKNVKDLFDEAIGAEIINAEINLTDRVIRLNTSSGNFYFMVRRKYTNFILHHSDNLIFFKHSNEVKEELLQKELLSEYTNAFNFPSISLDDSMEYHLQVIKSYPFIGKEIVLEAASRVSGTKKENFISVLNKVILEIVNEKPALFINNRQKEVRLAPETFSLFSYDEKKVFDSLFPALNGFLARKFSLEGIGDKEKLVRKTLEKELNKITGRIDKLKTRIETGSREEAYRKTADLLLMNRHLLHKGLTEIKVQDFYTDGNEISIKLDPALSPQQNIDAYFEKAKNEKINYEKSLQLYRDTEKQFNRFRSFKERLENYSSAAELQQLMKELKIKDNKALPEKDDLKNKFKQYIIDKVYQVYVGKDSKNNDLLTTRFAKQNDYWFHARSVSGSHVVLKYEKSKDVVPKNVLKKAAALAAYHSKAKTAGVVPVSYTFKKYVIKKKGMEPGKVALLKEEVLLVKPEIPDGVEYVSNE